MWEIEIGLIRDWLDDQDKETVAMVFAALEVLQDLGPSLGRPLVDTINGSRLKNLKELRPASPHGTEVRILFVFDPQRKAVMLVAGDKSEAGRRRDRWGGWYAKAIVRAEQAYEGYLNRSRL